MSKFKLDYFCTEGTIYLVYSVNVFTLKIMGRYTYNQRTVIRTTYTVVYCRIKQYLTAINAFKRINKIKTLAILLAVGGSMRSGRGGGKSNSDLFIYKCCLFEKYLWVCVYFSLYKRTRKRLNLLYRFLFFPNWCLRLDEKFVPKRVRKGGGLAGLTKRIRKTVGRRVERFVVSHDKIGGGGVSNGKSP